MIETDDQPVAGDPEAIVQLTARVDDLDTAELTAYARSLGLNPPDNRPGWTVSLEYNRDCTERGLYWVDPNAE
jgi:hypothetical protein